jgi:hypothetical protein
MDLTQRGLTALLFLLVAPAIAGAQPKTDFAIWQDQTNFFDTVLDYSVAKSSDANNCEFYVNSIGRGTFENGGFTVDWYEMYVSVAHQQDGQIKNVGMLSIGHDGIDHYTFGTKIEPDYWKVGFTDGLSAEERDQPIVEVAAFVDVRRPSGRIERLWQSAHGANYSVEATF